MAAQTIYQTLIDAELTSVIGVGPWEYMGTRTGLRNGSHGRCHSGKGERLGWSVARGSRWEGALRLCLCWAGA
jgi:hypothetical protein